MPRLLSVGGHTPPVQSRTAAASNGLGSPLLEASVCKTASVLIQINTADVVLSLGTLLDQPGIDQQMRSSVSAVPDEIEVCRKLDRKIERDGATDDAVHGVISELTHQISRIGHQAATDDVKPGAVYGR
jgi:hypothetical protein